MCRPGVGAANPLIFLWRALWRPTAPASRTKSRQTAEESRTSVMHASSEIHVKTPPLPKHPPTKTLPLFTKTPPPFFQNKNYFTKTPPLFYCQNDTFNILFSVWFSIFIFDWYVLLYHIRTKLYASLSKLFMVLNVYLGFFNKHGWTYCRRRKKSTLC